MKISKKEIAGVMALLFVLVCVLCIALRVKTDNNKQPENVIGERKNRYINVPDEYKSISEAMRHAREGDTVFVKEGSYEESVRLKNGVNLIGEDKDKVTIFKKAESQKHVLLVRRNDALVKGLTIEHTGEDLSENRAVGILLINSSARIEDCRVRNAAGSGLVVKDGGQPVIKNCLFESNGFSGIQVIGENSKPTIFGNRCLKNTLQGIYLHSCQAHVEDNICDENKNGILTSQKANSTLKGNQCCNNKQCGIYILRGSKCNAEGNRCRENGNSGIMVYEPNTVCTLVNNEVEKNQLYGIYILRGAKCNAEGNTCRENGYSGIMVYEPNTVCTLVNNEVEKNQLHGIQFNDGVSGVAEKNKCRFNKKNGINVSDGWSSLTLRENTCSDNLQNGILLGTRQTTIAEKNVCVDNGYAGISVYAYASLAKLNGNVCSRNKTDGIWFGVYAGGEAKDNVCTENERNGISIASALSAPKLINNNYQNNKGQGVYIVPGDFGNVRLMFIEEKFDELEKIAIQLRLQNPRGTDSGFQLSHFYTSICQYWEDFRPPLEQEMLKLAEKWIEEKPDSVTAHIVKSKLISRSGWRARGKRYARYVTKQGWRVFKSEHLKAWEVLAAAEALSDEDPELYATRLAFCVAIDKSRRDIDDIFYKGIKVSKNYYPLYREMGVMLLPRWFGKPGELEAFASKAVDMTASEEGESLYAVIAEVPIPYLGEDVELFLKYGFSYDRLKIAFQDLLKRYPNSNYHMNSFCLIASLHKDKKTAKELFEKIGDNWHWDIWDYRRVFDKYRNWANTKDSES